MMTKAEILKSLEPVPDGIDFVVDCEIRDVKSNMIFRFADYRTEKVCTACPNCSDSPCTCCSTTFNPVTLTAKELTLGTDVGGCLGRNCADSLCSCNSALAINLEELRALRAMQAKVNFVDSCGNPMNVESVPQEIKDNFTKAAETLGSKLGCDVDIVNLRPIACECGAESVGSPHASYCPKAGK